MPRPSNFQKLLLSGLILLGFCLGFEEKSRTDLNTELHRIQSKRLGHTSCKERLFTDLLNWIDHANRLESAFRKRSTHQSYTSTLLGSLQNNEEFLKRNIGSQLPARHSIGDDGIDYQIVFPDIFSDTQHRYPLLIDLPGLGMIGHRLNYRASKNTPLPHEIITVTPINDRLWKWNLAKLDSLLAHLIEFLPIDRDRIYLMGHSIGGNGVWEWAKRHPNTFAAISPISGWGKASGIDALLTTPALVIHGRQDPFVSINWNLALATTLNEMGGQAETLVIDKGGHAINDWHLRVTVIDWLLDRRKPS